MKKAACLTMMMVLVLAFAGCQKNNNGGTVSETGTEPDNQAQNTNAESAPLPLPEPVLDTIEEAEETAELPEPFVEYVEGHYHVFRESVDIHSYHSRSSGIVGQARLHDVLERVGVSEYDGKYFWYRIKYGDFGGYVMARDFTDSVLITDFDGSGVKYYFYPRRSGDRYWYFPDDFWVYKERERIPAPDILDARTAVNHEWLYEFTNGVVRMTLTGSEINKRVDISKGENGELVFTNVGSYDNQVEFASKGQGRGFVPPYSVKIDGNWDYSNKQYYEEIRKILGEPLNINTEAEDENHRTVTWEYEDLLFVFEEYEGEDSEGEYYEGSQLEKILSTDKGEYMFGIKHGMHIDELKTIFGDMDLRYYAERQTIYLPMVSCYSGLVFTDIRFENDRIKSIRWDWSGA